MLLVEDIIDTGMTLNYLIGYLKSKKPASIEVCALLDKRARRIADVAIKYVGFEVPDDVKEVYSGFGINLPKSNGDDSWTLPMPTRLVVDQSGIVRATDIGPDHTRRPEPQRTLDDVRALG